MSIGFLNRDGQLHTCTAYGHLTLADKIVKEMNVKVNNKVDAETYLQKIGWIVVRNHDVYSLVGYLDQNENIICLSKKQKEWLLKEYETCSSLKRESIDDLLDRNYE